MAVSHEDRALVFTPVHELAHMVRAKKLSPLELVQAVLRRIDSLNNSLHAFLTVCEEEAVQSARRAEEALAGGELWGPLHGMPIGIKDLYNTGGIRTTYGSLVYKDFVPDRDGLLAKRMKAAGCIIVGKTNAPEYGCAVSTENLLGEACVNPWNTGRTSGGSSGGSAASVAAGLCPLCPGSDGGGSIRIPSAFCGLFGLKPTYGRVPYDVDPVYGPAVDFICHGPMTRSVTDAAFLLNIMSGPDEEDYNTMKVPPPDYLHAVQQELSPLRIAWSPDLGYAAVSPEVRSITEGAVKIWETCGHHVEEASPPLDPPYATWEEIASSQNYLLYAFLLQKYPEKLTPYFRTSLELGRKLHGTDLVRDWIEVGKWRARMREFFKAYDILVTPATAVPAFPPGSTGEPLGHGVIEWSFTPFTPVFNFTHHPVAAVPCGFSSDGLPIGLQVVGRLGDEATLLSLSRVLEETIPWAENYPPVS